MPASNFLQRLRPIGAPGPAGPVGVPVDADTGPAAELAPVFAALAPVVEECDAIREQARAAAADEVAAAERAAGQQFADARSQAPAERAVAAAQVRDAGEAAADRLVAEAHASAAGITQRGQERLATLVEAVVDRVRRA